jgi:hypothetical protein
LRRLENGAIAVALGIEQNSLASRVVELACKFADLIADIHPHPSVGVFCTKIGSVNLQPQALGTLPIVDQPGLGQSSLGAFCARCWRTVSAPLVGEGFIG